jgi:protease-4
MARRVEQAGVTRAVESMSLDGMLALWRPAGSN